MHGESLHSRHQAGLEMIIAIDSTELGPALGGCRWRPYASSRDARLDAEALARTMTHKAALARLKLGGGKAVVVGDPRRRTREQLVAFGRFVESLEGRYITAADMGTGEQAMRVIREGTRHVVGLPKSVGGCGDPAPFTARGVFLALERALERLDRPLRGARVAVQGVGNVGSALVRQLLEAGASVVAADPDAAALAALPEPVERVAPEGIAACACDAFAPCGPGRVIDREVAGALRCAVVCGAANNPLVAGEVARALEERGILYVPDFLANAGGLIHLAVALEGGEEEAARRHLDVIPENLDAVIAQAKADRADLATTAERLAAAVVSGSADWTGSLGTASRRADSRRP